MRKDEMNWARAYQNYLSNFIRTGDPNGKSSEKCQVEMPENNWPQVKNSQKMDNECENVRFF